jgi:methyl coenzyme M reductase beta subunit
MKKYLIEDLTGLEKNYIIIKNNDNILDKIKDVIDISEDENIYKFLFRGEWIIRVTKNDDYFSFRYYFMRKIG